MTASVRVGTTAGANRDPDRARGKCCGGRATRLRRLRQYCSQRRDQKCPWVLAPASRHL